MSSSFYRPRRGRRPSSTDWLQILDVDGPFLAAPVVHDTWPDGLPALTQDQMDALRSASTLYDANPGTRDAFISHVLTKTLDWRHNLATGPDAAGHNVNVPEHHQTVEIFFALRAQDQDGAAQERPLLLGMILPPKTATTGRAPAGSGTWTAGPADRLAHALRMRKVPLGIVTNGDTWTLVTVSDGGAVSTATWTRFAWLEEPQTLRAFVALLTRTRFYGVPDDETLPGLLTKSLARQEEVTERLAEQSQAVVEMLVATLGRLDAQHKAEHGARLLPTDVGPAEVYQAAVTVLMRLVFLLYAEERGLLPLDDDTYASAYAVNTLADSLRDRATDHGEDALERTATGWYRLLALFRGVHRGARHEQLILPAYGGSLFDPDRFPWLEGRASADLPLGSGEVPAIDDRTLLKALDSLQTLQFAKERRQVSYRSLDVEQIGYVYEGLLDQDALTASDWVVSIAVSDKDPRKNGPELLLTDLEHHHAKGDEALAAWLVEQIKTVKGNRSKASILKALSPLEGDDKPRFERLVREACGNDDDVTARVLPFAKLLRLDPRDLPVAYPPGSLYLTDSTARAHSGAVYTPRFLAEQVVETTLEAIVYSPGPLDTEDKAAWKLKSPEQILNLKVCDIAAGSGAFLVAATRYLADRLLESRRQHDPVLAAAELTEDTSGSEDSAAPAALGLRELARAEQDELDARRAVIANCIYGVDINPMAIEMAKLSLWLTSLDRNRPFSFVDDHLAVGDSLLGIASPSQLIDLHFDPKHGRKLNQDTLDLFTSTIESDLKSASELRAQIPLIGDRDSRDAEAKQRLLRRAREITARLSLVADGLAAASLAGGKDGDYLTLVSLVSEASTGGDPDDQILREWVDVRLQRETGEGRHSPGHFPLLFPEAFTGGVGFDAIVGNPPFLGGTKISSASGTRYQQHLVRTIAGGRRGNADLIAYFLIRAAQLLSGAGVLGLIGTNTIAEGGTCDVGLRWLVESGQLKLFGAYRSRTWPTTAANLQFATLWATRERESIVVRAEGRIVNGLAADLREASRVDAEPYELAAQRGWAFNGSKVEGPGFVLTEEEAAVLLAANPRNADVVLPYLNGDDLNDKGAASRYVIDFRTWSRAKAAEYTEPFERVERLVKPFRAGHSERTTREMYWWFRRPPTALRAAAEGLSDVVALALTSNTLMPLRVPARQVFSHALAIFPVRDGADYGLLSSGIHYAWAAARTSTMRTDIRYTTKKVASTLPRPQGELAEARAAIEDLHKHRQPLLLAIGLTELYGRVQDRADMTADIEALRELHQKLDNALLVAYGWTDLVGDNELTCLVESAPARWLPSASSCREIVERLRELNHERYAAEVDAGLHGSHVQKTQTKTAAVGVAEVPTLFGGDA